MDWKVIKKKYPKAFKSLKWFYEDVSIIINKENRLGWYFTDGVHHVGMWTDIGNGMIYEFFDGQGLRIFIKQGTMDTYLDFDIENRIKDFKKEPRLSWKEKKATRQEIEETAFVKAFEILEKII